MTFNSSKLFSLDKGGIKGGCSLQSLRFFASFARNLFQCMLICSVTLLVFDSCKDNAVTIQENPQVIYQKQGLVDSVVVHECVALTSRFFSDTLDLSGYSKINITFNGLTNSDGSFIKILYHTDTSSNTELYSVMDIGQVSNNHSFTFTKPANIVWFELRTYINPPVCGKGEYKFTRARDLKIYGIN